ncbi:Hypothetical predicted protein [Marmota monax]|uniref:Uncharacterized protein n=1 Tax=Marmota monax TaxID=9995 RepID=A0A5E4ALW9_MARMO|nr:Hypothetical predicted protein [Marmota monax]
MPQAVSSGRKVTLWARMTWEQRENPGTVRGKRGTKSYVQFPEEIPPDGSFYFNRFLMGRERLPASPDNHHHTWAMAVVWPVKGLGESMGDAHPDGKTSVKGIEVSKMPQNLESMLKEDQKKEELGHHLFGCFLMFKTTGMLLMSLHIHPSVAQRSSPHQPLSGNSPVLPSGL